MAEQEQRISVIIPAYNEAESIGGVLERIQALEGAGAWEIVVVDDGSSDNTAAVAEEKGARVVRHTYNLGNGASVRAGGAAATGDILVFMDGDGQHPPEEIPKLLEHIPAYDMVVGARTKQSEVSRFRTLGNRGLTAVGQYLSGHRIGDLTSGFRAVKKSRFDEFAHLFPLRYSYPTTITLAMFGAGYFVKYVPLPSIKRREQGTSNIQPFRDGVRFLQIILRIVILFNPMKVFLPVSLILFGVGGVIALHDILRYWRLEESSLLTIILGAFCLLFGMVADQVSHTRRELHSLVKANSNKSRE